MTRGSNRLKDKLLGEPHGSANGRLKKAIIFKYVRLAGHDICYRCVRRIESIEELSIEHKISWQRASDPQAAYFDLDGIAFSHLRCNIRAARKDIVTRKQLNARSRTIFFEYHGCEPECWCGARPADVYHVNGDGSDNSLNNLQPLCRSHRMSLENTLRPKRKKKIVEHASVA